MDGNAEFDLFLQTAVEKWRAQNRKGFLELCILACVRGAGRIYGFAMLERLRRTSLDMSEGSLYPLLTRLVRESMLTAEWETPVEGHPRKYYTISDLGLAFLDQVQIERDREQASFQAILSGACDSATGLDTGNKTLEEQDDQA